MKRRILTAAVAASLLAGVAHTAAARDLTFGSYLPPKHNVNEYGLAPMFEELGKDVPWKLVAGGQLFSGNATLKSVGYGAADGGVVIPAYVQSALKNAFTTQDMMFAASDALAMNAAVMETFVTDCDECLEDYRQSGTVLLGTYAVDGWSMLCRDRIANAEDLKGKRVRTSGALGRLAQAYGATPVSMSSGDMIEAIARGQLDCILGSVAWLQAYPIEESIKSIYELRKGVVTVNLFVMNQDSWKNLGADKQKLMLEKMPRAIARTMIEGYTGDDAKAVALAKKMNIDMVKPEPAAEELFRNFQADELKTVVEKAKARGAKDGQKIVDSVLKNYAKWEKELSAFDRNDLEKLSENYAKLLWDNVYSKIDPAKL